MNTKAVKNRGGFRPGAGRKSIGEKRVVSLTLPPEHWAELEKEAQLDGISMATILREIVGVYLHLGKELSDN